MKHEQQLDWTRHDPPSAHLVRVSTCTGRRWCRANHTDLRRLLILRNDKKHNRLHRCYRYNRDKNRKLFLWEWSQNCRSNTGNPAAR